MQPSKRGNFFHIDSVQPITEGKKNHLNRYFSLHEMVYVSKS